MGCEYYLYIIWTGW